MTKIDITDYCKIQHKDTDGIDVKGEYDIIKGSILYYIKLLSLGRNSGFNAVFNSKGVKSIWDYYVNIGWFKNSYKVVEDGATRYYKDLLIPGITISSIKYDESNMPYVYIDEVVFSVSDEFVSEANRKYQDFCGRFENKSDIINHEEWKNS